jgi:DNA invertase Pin-like site-specific DNA recombinase
MAPEKPKAAFAYLRTSSAANVGVDKDSAKRQREAIATFAKRAGYEILAEFNDEAVSGADSLESRPGFAAMLESIEANGCKTIIVETASRFARDLMVQEVGYARLQERSIELIAADSPGSFQEDGPTARLVRQVLGAVAEFDKAVTAFRGARERKRKTGMAKMLDRRTGKCEGRKALHETVPEAVLMAKRLRRASPLNGDRMSLQRIAEHLAEAGHVNENGKTYNPKSVLAKVNGPRPKSAGANAA